ncbi:hypothetical protein [Salinibacter grassmerensis]|nr:hypothetical protein [Salinibacter grassmerensis]
MERHDIPDLPQRRDSTNNQIEDLREAAEQLGMYDTADLLATYND